MSESSSGPKCFSLQFRWIRPKLSFSLFWCFFSFVNISSEPTKRPEKVNTLNFWEWNFRKPDLSRKLYVSLIGLFGFRHTQPWNSYLADYHTKMPKSRQNSSAFRHWTVDGYPCISAYWTSSVLIHLRKDLLYYFCLTLITYMDGMDPGDYG